MNLERFTCPDCGAEHFQPEVDRAKFFMFRQPRCAPCQAIWDREHPPAAISLSMTTEVVVARDDRKLLRKA